MISQPISHWMKTVKEVFTEEILAAQGTVADSFEDESRLIIRSVLPWERSVGPGDRLQAGVALRLAGPNIAVYPYIFRRVCTNGAILAHVLGSQQVLYVETLITSEIDTMVRVAVRACCQAELFAEATEQIRAGKNVAADPALSMMPHLARLPRNIVNTVLDSVLIDWMQSTDHSRFGLMNAITARARDTADPEARWQLEELGGRVGVPSLSRLPSPLSGEVEIERTEGLVHTA